jgi:hypothetical protein
MSEGAEFETELLFCYCVVVDVILAPFIHAPLQPLSVSLLVLPEFSRGARYEPSFVE